MSTGCAPRVDHDRALLVETLSKVVLDRIGRHLTRRAPRKYRGREECGGFVTWNRHVRFDPTQVDVDAMVRETREHLFGDAPFDEYDQRVWREVETIVKTLVTRRTSFDRAVVTRVLSGHDTAAPDGAPEPVADPQGDTTQDTAAPR